MGISGNPITLSPDGKRLLTHKDHQVHLWDLASHKELCSFPAENIGKLHRMTLNFSADGRYACAGGAQDGSICGVCRGRRMPLAPDATTGQNAIAQAESFRKTVRCTGIILSKLDDLEPFDPEGYVEALFV